MLHRRSWPLSWAHPTAGVIAGAVLVNCVVPLYLEPLPSQTADFLFLIIGSGCIFLSRTWLVATITCVVGSWLFLSWPLQQPAEWINYRYAVVTATAVSFVIYATRIRTYEKLFEAQHRADAANRAKDAFLANMSHEIRTPMTAILGYADLLSDAAPRRQQIDAIETIQRNGRYLLQIVNDILDLSKLDAGMFVVERSTCSPIRLLDGVQQLMQVTALEKSIVLEFTCEGRIPERIESDELRLRQILINVIGNAVKFTDEGKVVVSTRLCDSDSRQPQLQFRVSDTGIGMSAEQIARLFEPFTQADASSSRNHGGTGLGLTISKRLSELLGGTIEVESVPNEGSTFTISIPTGSLTGVTLTDGTPRPHPSQEPTKARPTETNSAQRETIQTGTSQEPTKARPTETQSAIAEDSRVARPRILLAEDGPDNQRLISFLLDKLGGVVTIAGNGAEALELLMTTLTESEAGAGSPPRRAGFDLVVMDMQMPVMDGYTATRKAREAGFDGPILALTAHAMQGDRERCLQAGCNEFATKPIDRERLKELMMQMTSDQCV